LDPSFQLVDEFGYVVVIPSKPTGMKAQESCRHQQIESVTSSFFCIVFQMSLLFLSYAIYPLVNEHSYGIDGPYIEGLPIKDGDFHGFSLWQLCPKITRG
jgi:hypothetical protein